jgi:ribulose-phosphate 3-epimerase
MIEIIPTVVPHSFDDIVAAAKRYPFAGAIHVDFADGVFAPNTTWLPQKPESRVIDGVELEAHMMVANPRELGVLLASCGFSRIIGHVEALRDVSYFESVRKAGAKEVGLGILYGTPLEALEPFVSECDVVQMMSIASIGVQGIPYMPEAPTRIAQFHTKHPKVKIADDGGVSAANIVELAKAGVTRFCVGSALAKAADPASTYHSLMALAKSAIE